MNESIYYKSSYKMIEKNDVGSHKKEQFLLNND